MGVTQGDFIVVVKRQQWTSSLAGRIPSKGTVKVNHNGSQDPLTPHTREMTGKVQLSYYNDQWEAVVLSYLSRSLARVVHLISIYTFSRGADDRKKLVYFKAS